MAKIERKAFLFRAGVYPDKNITVTEGDLDNICAGTTEAPIKVQHTDTPFDGAMGFVKGLYRRGLDLFGTICFEPEAWALASKAGATKLSVAIPKEKNMLREVSLVKKPRIDGACYFSDDDTIEFNPDTNIAALFDGMSYDERRNAVNNVLNADGKYAWYIEKQDDSTVIASKDDELTRYDYTIDAEGKAHLANPVKVVRNITYTPVVKTFNDGGSKMPEITDAQLAEFNKKAALAESATETLKTQAETIAKLEGNIAKFAELVTAMDADNKKKEADIAKFAEEARITAATNKVEALIRGGKLTPAQKDEAIKLFSLEDQTIKFGDADVPVSTLIETMLNKGKNVSFGEQGEDGGEGEDTLANFGGRALGERLGITEIPAERLADLQKRFHITD